MPSIISSCVETECHPIQISSAIQADGQCSQTKGSTSEEISTPSTIVHPKCGATYASQLVMEITKCRQTVDEQTTKYRDPPCFKMTKHHTSKETTSPFTPQRLLGPILNNTLLELTKKHLSPGMSVNTIHQTLPIII